MEDPVTVQCPWCGESFITFADPSAGDGALIEDCQVCCRPIELVFKWRRDGSVTARAVRS